MFEEKSPETVFLVNSFLIALWHYIVYNICISLDVSFFDENKKIYRPFRWERDGKIYSDKLRIQKWKDYLPVHTGKNGFSKEHLEEVSVDYLNEFIMETCRGEWNHTLNSILTVLLFAVNDISTASCFSIVVIAGNLPFVIIQRYNRFRLQKLRLIIIRKQQKRGVGLRDREGIEKNAGNKAK